MRRHILGIIGLGFIAAWAYFLLRHGPGDDSRSMAIGVVGRAGFTMIAVWLAFPQLEQLAKRVSPWVIFGCVIGGGVMIWRPKLFLIVLPLIGVLLALQFVKWLFAPLPDSNQGGTKKPSDESND